MTKHTYGKYKCDHCGREQRILENDGKIRKDREICDYCHKGQMVKA